MHITLWGTSLTSDCIGLFQIAVDLRSFEHCYTCVAVLNVWHLQHGTVKVTAGVLDSVLSS